MQAERPLTSNPKKISFITDQMWACAWYRCHVPGMELHRRGHDVVLHEDIGSLAGRTPDVLVIQAMVHPQLFEEMQRVKASGGRIIFDMDDEPFSLHPDNPGHVFWARPEAQDMLVKFLRAADVVTTTTPELAEGLGRFQRDTVVLPNMLPAEYWPSERLPARDTDELVVGWAGSSSHAPDLREIQDILIQILDRFPKVQIHVAGAQPGWFRQLHPRLKFLQPVRIEQYSDLISGFDIALAPLLDSKFNRSKSDLKAVEYGMLGLPVVASKLPAYSRFIRHGENGFLAVTQRDWLQRVSALIQDRGLRDTLGANVRRAAQNRVIERHIGRWEKVYGIQE